MSNIRKHTNGGGSRVGGGKLMRELNTTTSPRCTKVTNANSQILNYDICTHSHKLDGCSIYVCFIDCCRCENIKRIIMLPSYKNMHITKVANCFMLSVAKQTSSQVQL